MVSACLSLRERLRELHRMIKIIIVMIIMNNDSDNNDDYHL